MKSKMQHSGTCRRAVIMALALTMVLLPALAAAPWAQAQTYNVLYNFTGGSDGGNPVFGGLVRDKSGNLYGVTEFGGSSNCGTVFKVDTRGKETVLWSFTCGADGGYPFGTLAMSPGGKLFGTAYYGGAHSSGVVFQVNPKTRTETVLYSFTGGSDGGDPFPGLVRGPEGTLYGASGAGGAYGDGVVFKVDPKSGTETVLHSFDYSDGDGPLDGLIGDSKGNFYGTAYMCGSGSAGVVFSIHP
jgi:uncharacterized repeat protein (TIGR03803 family)